MKDNIIPELVRKLKYEVHNFREINSILIITKSAARHKFMYMNVSNPKKCGTKRKLGNKERLAIKRNISQLQLSGYKVNSTKLVRNCNLKDI